jgi:hypothetical protein
MIGGSTLGNSLTPNKEIPMDPKSTMVKDITMAKTGLLILMVERLAIFN